MEENNQAIPAEKELNPALCVNCQLNKFEEGYPSKLCTDCRTELVNFPIPRWIFVAAAALLILLVVELFRTPGLIMGAIHLARGQKAIEEKKYRTAIKELDKALEVAPNALVTNANMIIASAYCMDGAKYSLAYQTVGERRIEDKDLYDQCIEALNFYSDLIPRDTLIYARLAGASTIQEVDAIYQEQQLYDSLNVDLTGISYVADRYFDLKEYKKSEEALQKVLTVNDRHPFALGLMSAIKREEGKCEEAMQYCDRLLELNKEDEDAYARKAKIALKCKEDEKATQYAQIAMEINPTSLYCLEAKAMVEYFSNDLKKSKETLNLIRATETEGDNRVSSRLEKVLNGETIYR